MGTHIQDTYIYRSTDIALYLVALANDRKISINITKVQKLLYIVYGAYLRAFEQRLLDEHPQAWPYGPVFPRTRKRLLNEDLPDISRKDVKAEVLNEIEKDTKLSEVMDLVLKHFGGWYAGSLTEWSHEKGSPWDKTRKMDDFEWGDVIPDQYIFDYFRSIMTM